MSLCPLNDGISRVELLDVFGDDLTVVNAARVSYAKESAEMCDVDERLIRYLASHGHWTPFAQPQLRFRLKMPIFVAREWYRHTVGFTRNEVSRRYVDSAPECYAPDDWRLRPKDGRKQGSEDEVHRLSKSYSRQVWEVFSTLSGIYGDMVREGVAPEMARMILPQSMYTEFIETGSLAAYARLCDQRTAPDAQQETRLYAEAVAALIEPHFPVAWKELMGA